MPVTKTNRECYEIRDGKGEWATIALADWERPSPEGQPYYSGQILIHSSYGSWANSWSHCGSPFKEFLQKIEFLYTFRKFMGSDLGEFDPEKSLKGVRERLCEHRKHAWLKKDDARALWDGINDVEDQLGSSEHGWVAGLEYVRRDLYDQGRPEAARFLDEPWEFITKSPKEGPRMFWDTLWSLFIQALKEETSGATKGLQTQSEAVASH